MVSSIRKKYEEYKKYGNIIMDYDEILLFYPDYYKTKVELENISFITKEDADKYFNENYKNSEIYKKLTELAMAEDEIYSYMNHNKDIKYESIKILFESLINSCINICELIDYIGHYPSTWPVPTEQEKNPKMEALMEEYDIIVRYHLNDDLDKMQITSDTVVRIIDKLFENLEKLNKVKSKLSSNDWLLTVKLTGEKREQLTSELIQEIEQFPLSDYQKRGKSEREEGKKYLRLQHGSNIIK